MKMNNILIVGAGPVGLYMASECLRYGLPFDIIDKKPGLSIHSKAFGIHSRTLLTFTQSGFIEPVLQQGLKITNFETKENNKTLFQLDFSEIDALYPEMVVLPQDQTENIFNDKLLKNNIFVQWNTELTAIQQTSTGSQVTLNCTDQLKTAEYKWVIACDGPHSALRDATHLKFIGGRYENVWWLADLKMQTSLPEDKVIIFFSGARFCAYFPHKELRHRLILLKPDQDMPISLENIIAETKKYIKEDFTVVETIWLSEFHISHRLIEHYRYKNIFFAGDAAHIHSPVGGQGLNTGIQDIQNLAWKLALVEQGKAKIELLDSYEEERIKIGRMLLKSTDMMTRTLLIKRPWKKALRNFLISTITGINLFKTAVVKRMAELTINYGKSSIVKQRGKTGLINAGQLLPNIYLEDLQQNKQNLFVLLKGTKHHLLVFFPENKEVPVAISFLEKISSHYASEISGYLIVSTRPTIQCNASVLIDPDLAAHHKLKLTSSTVVLIRPDQYIGYSQAGLDPEKLLLYLRQTIFIYNH
jgi:2-polyprenyl-6-methoxyphenol hydroxylase-like FAD-dependent oxidoreductase